MFTEGCIRKFDRLSYRARIEEKLGLSLDFDSSQIDSSSLGAPVDSSASAVPLTELLENMQVPRSKLNKAAAYVRQMIDRPSSSLEGMYMRQGRGYLILSPEQTREILLPILQREGLMQKQINRNYGAFFTSIQRTS